MKVVFSLFSVFNDVKPFLPLSPRKQGFTSLKTEVLKNTFQRENFKKSILSIINHTFGVDVILFLAKEEKKICF